MTAHASHTRANSKHISADNFNSVCEYINLSFSCCFLLPLSHRLPVSDHSRAILLSLYPLFSISLTLSLSLYPSLMLSKSLSSHRLPVCKVRMVLRASPSSLSSCRICASASHICAVAMACWYSFSVIATHTHAHARQQVRTHAHRHTHTHTQAHKHIRRHKHTNIQTHTQQKDDRRVRQSIRNCINSIRTL